MNTLRSSRLRVAAALAVPVASLLLCAATAVHAAPLAGPYTVGAGQAYPTLTAAVAAAMSQGVAGPTEFRLTDATYGPGETFPIAIGAIPGANATNTLTIRPATGQTPTLTGSSTTAILLLNGCDHVVIDGSNGSGARDLTIANTGAGTSSAVVWGATTAANDPVTHCTVRRVTVLGSGPSQTLFGVGFGGATISLFSTGTGNVANTIDDCDVRRAQHGIYSSGASAAAKNTGTIVRDNRVGGAGVEATGRIGIRIRFEDGPLVTGNRVLGVATSAAVDAAGISMGLTSFSATVFAGSEVTNATITANVVTSVVQNNSGSVAGILVGSAASGTTRIVNNRVSGVGGTAQAGAMVAGIACGGGGGSVTRVLANSVSLAGNRGSAAGHSFALAIGGTNPAVEVRDDILVNTQVATTGRSYAIGLAYPAPYTNLAADANDLLATGGSAGFARVGGLAAAGSERTSLAAWQAETGGDALSLSAAPGFIATDDLHIGNAGPVVSPVARAGVTHADVTVDADGQARKSPPDIGADEFETWRLTLVAVDGTIVANPAQSLFNPGGTVQLTAVPAAGFTFAGWSGDASGAANPLTLTRTADASVTALFTAAPQAPVVDPIATQNGAEGALLTVTPHATDPQNHALTWSGLNLPAGAAVDPGSGVLTWTPGPQQAGTWTAVTLQASNGSATGSTSFTIVISDPTPPVILGIDDFSIASGTVFDCEPIANDGDGDLLTWSVDGPSGVTIDPQSGAFQWVVPAGDADLQFTLHASDGLNTASESFTMHVVTVRPYRTSANWAGATVLPTGVNAATGEFVWSAAPDLRGTRPTSLPIQFVRTYLAFDPANLELGPHWRNNFDWRLSVTLSQAQLVDDHGRVSDFTLSAGTWQLTAPLDVPFQLAPSGSGYVVADPRDSRLYRFDAGGLLTSIEDGKGNALTVTQGPNGPAHVSDGFGQSLDYVYDVNGNLVQLTDGHRTTHYVYDMNGNLVTYTDAAGNATTYGYGTGTQSNTLLRITTPLGDLMTQLECDGFGRVVLQSDALGRTYLYDYHGLTCDVTVPGADEGTWRITHDTALHMSSVIDPAGGVWTYTYDGLGRLTRAERPLGDVERFTYDPASGKLDGELDDDGDGSHRTYVPRTVSGVTFWDLSTLTRADGGQVAYTYDAAGNIVSMTDEAGHTWSSTFNGRAQVLTTTNPAGGVTTYTYDANGNLVSSLDPVGELSTFARDPLGRVTQVTFPTGTTQTRTWDALGHVLTLTDEFGGTTVWQYDANGRVVSITNPLGQHTLFGYDAAGRPVSTTDALGHTTTTTYTPSGRVAAIADPTGVLTRWAYDSRGNIVRVSDDSGIRWTYGYDANNRRVTTANALGTTSTLVYDEDDHLVGTIDELGHVQELEYDRCALSRVNGPEGMTYAFGYDPRGGPASIDEGTIGMQVSIAPLGTIATTHDPDGGLHQYTYGLDGRLTSATDPRTSTIQFQYDAGRVTGATFPGGLGSLAITYDAAYRVVRQAYSDGTTYDWVRDAVGRPTSTPEMAVSYDAAGRPVTCNGLAFTYDAAGRPTSMTYAAGRTVQYAYDSRGRLASVQDWLGGATTFTYDAAGRRIAMTRPNGTHGTYVRDAAGRTTSMHEMAGATTLSAITLVRDGLGRPTDGTCSLPLPFGGGCALPLPPGYPGSADSTDYSLPELLDPLGRALGDSTRTFDWDLGGHPKRWKFGRDSTHRDMVEYKWGPVLPLGRVHRDTTRDYVWNHITSLPTLAVERDGAGADVRYYVYTPHGELLEAIDAASGRRHFYHYDATGNTTFLTGESGAIESAYAYTAYGVLVQATGDSLQNPFTYGGRWGVMREPGTDLYIMRQRVYDAATARFLSPDPAAATFEPRAQDRYQYALQNPLAYIDPTGRCHRNPDGTWTICYSPATWDWLVKNFGDKAAAMGEFLKQLLGDKGFADFVNKGAKGLGALAGILGKGAGALGQSSEQLLDLYKKLYPELRGKQASDLMKEMRALQDRALKAGDLSKLGDGLGKAATALQVASDILKTRAGINDQVSQYERNTDANTSARDSRDAAINDAYRDGRISRAQRDQMWRDSQAAYDQSQSGGYSSAVSGAWADALQGFNDLMSDVIPGLGGVGASAANGIGGWIGHYIWP